MHAFSTCGHFQSCDEDGGYTILYAIAENPMLHCALWFHVLWNRIYCQSTFSIAGIGLWTVFASVTLTR